ncbi:chemotaxis protein methyltransferase CheR [Oceanobacillus limi]|uniref:protein-glutamate O-methyltransferase n=1 Tax=Oceanobacillus limi TaxID=930131 RepID=A0A1H9ZHJ6_9BACI|nr:protein-glutamate O-methyltransferase CheR [Oceanobacillus limi]SES80540.1 chemotaxis protein methyltransferase CheR [Oceanobacillus limi]
MTKDYYEFIKRIKLKLGIDLTLYKEAQMKRRLTSLRDKRGYGDFLSYYETLDKDDKLLAEFVDRITINVSEFYRNPKRWDVLIDTILPMLSKDKSTLKIWSAACSTGEEPYSIALIMREYFPQLDTTIIATDIDDNVLKKAKQGIYQTSALKDLPSSMKDKYFKFENSLYHINDSVKQDIQFKKHNLLEDAYPKNVDLIICRNVLIYFTDQAKDKIYADFTKALSPEGVLFVGSTEQIFSPSAYNLHLVDTFFYQKD